ncbi:MAG: tetratricopeptide repeat protein [Meiothermus sp.]|uniref:tetratricopeptide repeat protein n=1 Tax=Meiothermus sp. TaxID=1955249 RepID=UPI0025DFDCEA|nr:tetratricopeptide repeat protein [Meiothermus sp.]MCS7057333.1 tetratricopeptide repeat protein [Meiothermus sp.]MCS7194445.1 tetratricopeptide repeat protein [Meiothermus sp.]MCX7741621.1 tetratricopeptide repeat protein [Meiothermus sp.]MDW8091075.1 tetratricopeptide repeat protein [Meiothermus sp.]MDW8481391.1 tetratricopeptide repeat protein [Meiothermus sp.]
MRKRDMGHLQSNLLALLEAHPDKVAPVLKRWVSEADGYVAARQLVEEVFSLIPKGFLRDNPTALGLYAQTLSIARMHEELLEQTEGLPLQTDYAKALLYRAWALNRAGRSQESLGLLERIEQLLEPENRGQWLRFKAEAMARLHQPGWQEVYAQASQCLKGSELGRCLHDWGYYLYRQGQTAEARSLWGKALAHVHHDPYYQAWLHHNLGITVLHSHPEEAEYHLLQAAELSKRKEAGDFRARALCGLAAVRRTLGEWERALKSYHAAVQAAKETDDLRVAYQGIGLTLRLMGKPAEALAYFWKAHAAEPLDEVYVDIAIANLMLNNPNAAETALNQARQIGPRAAMKALLARAELARRKKKTEALAALLGQIEWSQPWLLEEQACLPALFAEARQRGYLEGPRNRARPLEVEVRAGGVLQVKVNGREIPLSPTSRAGEVLVLLLENGGEATLDQLMDQLYPEEIHRHKARRAIWPHIERLREALGWERSVEARGGTYRLDPRARWRYDMRDPRVRRKGKFMEGVFSNWVQQRREEIMQETSM